MILSAPEIPDYARIELHDPYAEFAAVNRIHFHGGIIDIDHDALGAVTDTEPLTHSQELALALSAIGLSCAESGVVLYKGEETLRTQVKSACHKLDAFGAHAKVVAVGRAFETGYFLVHRAIEPSEIALRYANLIRHRATGQPAVTFQDAQDGTRTARKRGLDRLTKLIRLKDGRQVQGLVTYGFLTGIIQAEPYTPYKPANPTPLMRINQTGRASDDIHLSA